MIGAFICMAGVLVLGPQQDASLEAVFTSAVQDGLVFESDINWHRGDYARAGMARVLGAELDPGDVLAWTDAAWLAWSWDHTELGHSVCLRGIELQPTNTHLLYESAVLSRLWGDDAWSVSLLRTLHRLDPSDELGAIALGAGLRKAERWEEAAQAYRALAEHHPGHPSARRFLDRYEAWGHMRPSDEPAETDRVPEGVALP